VIVLGIESSCDETSAAVLADGVLRSNIVSSQYVHARYGGVVPELASRAHLRSIMPIIAEALGTAGVTSGQLTAIAATQGPGLIGSLLVGLNTGKAMALALGIPFLPVNHLEAHMFAPFLGPEPPAFPFLALIVSGGHTLLVRVDALDRHSILGGTIDDAAGEAFDKVAKMLGLGFPGGPEIDRRAALGDPAAVALPRPYKDSGDDNFSFSGLKTAVLYHLRRTAADASAPQPPAEATTNDLCASFQRAVVDVLAHKTFRAAARLELHDIVLAGGVSANRELRATFAARAEHLGLRLHVPATEYSTDNGAMVAMLATLQLEAGVRGSLDAPAYARSIRRFHRGRS
jgi:N6-L-threonylcarbamoyladenine synthase